MGFVGIFPTDGLFLIFVFTPNYLKRTSHPLRLPTRVNKPHEQASMMFILTEIQANGVLTGSSLDIATLVAGKGSLLPLTVTLLEALLVGQEYHHENRTLRGDAGRFPEAISRGETSQRRNIHHDRASFTALVKWALTRSFTALQGSPE